MEKRYIEERKAALLKWCKFYKGEEECPQGLFLFGWECESLWVHCLLENDTKTIDDAIAFFRQFKLDTNHTLIDGTPIAIQALLFNRFCYQSDKDPLILADAFPRYYVVNYKSHSEEDGLMMNVAESPSRDLDVLLTELHHAKGAYFVSLLKEIASHGEFWPVENESNIFFTGGERGEDFPNLLNAARKAVAQGYKVFILPNPKEIRTADFIFERKGVYRMYDLKTIQGKASISNRLNESIGQTNRVLLNMTTEYSTRKIVSDIKKYFEKSDNAIEVLIFKGKNEITIYRRLALNTRFYSEFKKMFEK